jgi:electron transport complex protein RnfD
MLEQRKLLVSHAPFLHRGERITDRNYQLMLAAAPAALMGIYRFGAPALGVIALSMATAVFWEWAFNRLAKRPVTVGDGNAALIGLLFAMLVPATMPWWAVVTGTFVAVVIGKHIFGGIGGNTFNPVVLSIAILMVSWKDLFDFDAALLNYDVEYTALYPLAALKAFGPSAIESISLPDLLLGRQFGGIGVIFGLGLLLGGIYLILRGVIRWEISLAFLAGIYLTAFVFHLYDPQRFAAPVFHLLTGYTLVGAFFLATEDASSPVCFIPMLIFGALGGVMTMLIRNLGAYADGVPLAILVINLVHPLLDKIRPNALGKVT